MGGTTLLLMMVAIPLMLFFWNYSRSAGKTLCIFLEPDGTYTPQLCPHDSDFVYDTKTGDAYYIYTSSTPSNRVRYVRYPTGWPVFLQQVVPSALYERGNGEPLDWKDTGKRVVSSKEVGAAMEPQWLKNIIKGASEAQGESRLNRMLPLLSLVAVLLCLVFIFVLMTKLGGLQTAIEALKLTK